MGQQVVLVVLVVLVMPVVLQVELLVLQYEVVQVVPVEMTRVLQQMQPAWGPLTIYRLPEQYCQQPHHHQSLRMPFQRQRPLDQCSQIDPFSVNS